MQTCCEKVTNLAFTRWRLHWMWWRTSNCSSLLIYRPREDERLSWPSWLTYSGRLTHISGHPSATGRAQDGERTLARDWRSTAEPRRPTTLTIEEGTIHLVAVENHSWGTVHSGLGRRLWCGSYNIVKLILKIGIIICWNRKCTRSLRVRHMFATSLRQVRINIIVVLEYRQWLDSL